jgi:hypothetical protein
MNMETPEFYSITAQVITRDVFASTSCIYCEDTRTYHMIPETQMKSMAKVGRVMHQRVK